MLLWTMELWWIESCRILFIDVYERELLEKCGNSNILISFFFCLNLFCALSVNMMFCLRKIL